MIRDIPPFPTFEFTFTPLPDGFPDISGARYFQKTAGDIDEFDNQENVASALCDKDEFRHVALKLEKLRLAHVAGGCRHEPGDGNHQVLLVASTLLRRTPEIVRTLRAGEFEDPHGYNVNVAARSKLSQLAGVFLTKTPVLDPLSDLSRVTPQTVFAAADELSSAAATLDDWEFDHPDVLLAHLFERPFYRAVIAAEPPLDYRAWQTQLLRSLAEEDALVAVTATAAPAVQMKVQPHLSNARGNFAAIREGDPPLRMVAAGDADLLAARRPLEDSEIEKIPRAALEGFVPRFSLKEFS